MTAARLFAEPVGSGGYREFPRLENLTPGRRARTFFHHNPKYRLNRCEPKPLLAFFPARFRPGFPGACRPLPRAERPGRRCRSAHRARARGRSEDRRAR